MARPRGLGNGRRKRQGEGTRAKDQRHHGRFQGGIKAGRQGEPGGSRGIRGEWQGGSVGHGKVRGVAKEELDGQGSGAGGVRRQQGGGSRRTPAGRGRAQGGQRMPEMAGKSQMGRRRSRREEGRPGEKREKRAGERPGRGQKKMFWPGEMPHHASTQASSKAKQSLEQAPSKALNPPNRHLPQTKQNDMKRAKLKT